SPETSLTRRLLTKSPPQNFGSKWMAMANTPRAFWNGGSWTRGKSPDFPPTVSAGVDRDVVLGGKTYLSGKVKLLKPNSPSARVTWSKESGPGNVTFAEADAAETTATFSAPGDYVLKLSAGEGKL